MRQANFIFYYLAPIWDKRKEEMTLGGTYLALINLTRELARQGYEVIVFADCGHKTDTACDKLTYIPVNQFDYEMYDADVFVSGRIMNLEWERILARKKVLWSQDNIIPDPTMPLEKGLDLIVVTSECHKKMLLQQHPAFPAEQMPIIFNSIEIDSYPTPNQIEKVHAKGIYLSHPGRGLGNLLEMIPQIKQVTPDLHVHIFSSWLPYSYFTKHESDKKMVHLLAKLQNMSDITWSRGVAQPRLKEVLASCYFHLYPTEFEEIFCYAAIQACMSGAPPITTNTGVFPQWQTMSDAFFLVDIEQKNWKDNFVETIKIACDNPDLCQQKRKNARNFILEHLRVDKVAYQWIALIE